MSERITGSTDTLQVPFMPGTAEFEAPTLQETDRRVTASDLSLGRVVLDAITKPFGSEVMTPVSDYIVPAGTSSSDIQALSKVPTFPGTPQADLIPFD